MKRVLAAVGVMLAALVAIAVVVFWDGPETKKATVTAVPSSPVTTEPVTVEKVTLSPKEEPKKVKASEKPSEAPANNASSKWTPSPLKTSKPLGGDSRKPQAPSSPSPSISTPSNKPLPTQSDPESPVEEEPTPSETEGPVVEEPQTPEEPSDRYAWLDTAETQSGPGMGGFWVTQMSGKYSYVEVLIKETGVMKSTYTNAVWFNAMPGTYTAYITPYDERGWAGIPWELTVVVPE